MTYLPLLLPWCLLLWFFLLRLRPYLERNLLLICRTRLLTDFLLPFILYILEILFILFLDILRFFEPPIRPRAAIILFVGSNNALQFTDAGFVILESGKTSEFVGLIKSCEIIL